MVGIETVPVPKTLTRYIASIWSLCAGEDDTLVERVFGTGEPSLTIHCANPFVAHVEDPPARARAPARPAVAAQAVAGRSGSRALDPQPRCAVCGQSRGFSDVAISGLTATISISFTAAGLRAFCAVPAEELRGRTVDGSLLSKTFRDMAVRVAGAPPGDERRRALYTSLERACMPPDDPGYTVADAMVREIRRAAPRLTISRIVEESGIGERTLQRLFADYVGLSPKALSIVARITHAARLLTEAESLTDVALAAGFYDHPQFTRTFKAATGYSPREFRALHCRSVGFLQEEIGPIG